MTFVSPPSVIAPAAHATSVSNAGSHASSSTDGFTQRLHQERLRQEEAQNAQKAQGGDEKAEGTDAAKGKDNNANPVDVADAALSATASKDADDGEPLALAGESIAGALGLIDTQPRNTIRLPASVAQSETPLAGKALNVGSADSLRDLAHGAVGSDSPEADSAVTEGIAENCGRRGALPSLQTMAAAATTTATATAIEAAGLSLTSNGFTHQTQKDFRATDHAARTVKASKNTVRQSSVDGLSVKAAQHDLDTPKLDSRTQNFVNTLEASVALTRRFERNANNEQSFVAYPAGAGTGAELGPAATGMTTPPSTTHSPFGTVSQMAYLGVNTPMMHPGWAQAMSQQVLAFLKMDSAGNQVAQLRLDPPELGPLKVAIAIKDGVATANFVSANAAVRSAVEQALPELASQLNNAGLSLGQASVGEQESRDAAGGTAGGNDKEASAGSRAGGAPDRAAGVSGAPPAPQPAKRQALGLVHTYA